MRYLLPLAVLLLLIGSALTAVAQIRPGERGVVRRFGQVVDTPGPGLWIGLPWGMDRVDRVPVDRIRNVAVGYTPDQDESSLTTPPGQLLTGDHNLVNVQVILHYQVDESQVVSYLEQEDRVDSLIARAAEAVLAEWIAGHKIDDVLLRGKTALAGPRQDVQGAETGVIARLTHERVAPYRLGVEILDAEVAYLFPPNEVKQAFDEVTRAQTSMQTREHAALQEAATLLRQAETEKFQIEKRTEAYVPERLELARAEAARFAQRLEQYHRLRQGNPEFLTGLWWDELGRLFAKLKENGRVDLLDNHLGSDGLDISGFAPMPKKK